MDVGKRIQDLRHEHGMTARELGDVIGVSQSYISLLENNKRRLNTEILARVARHFGLTLAQFFGEAGAPKPSRPGVDLDRLYKSGHLHAMADANGNVEPVTMRTIPIVSRVAAGDPAGFTDGEYPVGFAEEFVPAPVDLEDVNAFALRIHGDSMAPRFRDNDIVICSPGRTAESGDAVVAKVRGDETTCKVLAFDGDRLVLSPVNPSYPAQIYSRAEVDWIYPVVICQRREKR
jgi:phage repressor protein C with HTH and peptisase S24 domain